MTLAAAQVTFAKDRPVLLAGASLPVEALVLGKPVAEAAELLPRLFNLCRAAQGMAARLALGLPAEGPDPAAEIIRDHMLRVCVTLPRAFGLPGIAIPADASRLLGDQGLPERLAELDRWTSPAAGLARHIRATFDPGVAVTAALPPAPALAEGAFENSAAARQADHPLLADTETRFGRGPLWRYLGLVADLKAALLGQLPSPALRDGIATVAAARGTYALRITQAGGRVTGMTRRTPTDHLLAPCGALIQALASLPRGQRPLLPAVIALHDPCVPVTLREVSHA
jgi:hypothetical protein